MKKRLLKVGVAGLMIFLLALFGLVDLPLFPQQATAVALAEPFGNSRESVLCIDDNEQALIWRLRTIDMAQEELILVTFSLRDDYSGRDVMSALLEAAKRGVAVKILLDGLNGAFELSASQYFSALIAHPNVQAKLYNPLDVSELLQVNYRMHDKYMIVDHDIYILGGRNTNDLFLGSYVDDYKIDREILVYAKENGPSMAQLREYFTRVWDLPCNIECSIADKSQIEDTQVDMARHYQYIRNTYPELAQEVDWDSETLKANKVSLLANPIELGAKEPELLTAMYELMQAGESIIIETPYIICDDDMYEKLAALNEAGKEVQIILNAVESSANPFGSADYLNQKSEVQRTGSCIFEVLCKQSLHRKTLLIDDSLSIVGSYNWDMRSTYLDTGLMLVIDSPALNAQLRESSLALMEQSRHVAPDGTETLGLKSATIKIGMGKKLFYKVLRIIIIPLRKLL